MSLIIDHFISFVLHIAAGLSHGRNQEGAVPKHAFIMHDRSQKRAVPKHAPILHDRSQLVIHIQPPM